MLGNARSRKILCIAVLIASFAGVDAKAAQAINGTGTTVQPDLLRAKLLQVGRELIFTLRTTAPVTLTQLEPLPSPRSPESRYLCLALGRGDQSGERRICVGGSEAHRRVGVELVDATGKVTRKTSLKAKLKRPEPLKLTLALSPGEAGLTPRRYRWRVLEDRGACEPPVAKGCEDQESLPAQGFLVFRLRPVRLVGCTGGSPGLVFNGPRDRRVVALTFDDGPSVYTPGFLSVLERDHVHGTFFPIGQEIAGRAEMLRRMLRDGDEIGNHTIHHNFYPSYEDLARANAVIRQATDFEPCLFRPPGGGFNSAVVAAAGEANMKTILWDVDPSDWALPGTGAIYSRVVGAAQPGSIILMHDGGGDRGETLAALPSIIDTLRARGYAFATVSELLGQRMIYNPYG